MAAGSIELLKRNPKSPIASRTNKQMTVTTPYLILPNTWFTAANIASTAATVVVKPAEPLLPKPVSPPLPEGFTERKQAVVRTLAVNTDSIVLRVYDNGIVDGDIVSVIYNGNVIIDKLSLTGRIVELKYPLTPMQLIHWYFMRIISASFLPIRPNWKSFMEIKRRAYRIIRSNGKQHDRYCKKIILRKFTCMPGNQQPVALLFDIYFSVVEIDINDLSICAGNSKNTLAMHDHRIVFKIIGSGFIHGYLIHDQFSATQIIDHIGLCFHPTA